jgi:MFS family permease
MAISNRLRDNSGVVRVLLCLGPFMALLDTAIVNVAGPSMIYASLDEVLWVLNAYVFVFAVSSTTSKGGH